MPIMDVTTDEINSLFAQYDDTLAITHFEAIRLGCKNSNYDVCTNKGRFVLRITHPGDLNNEIPAHELVKDKIHVPSLLFHATWRGANTFIYRYIHGVSLQKRILDSGQCEPFLLAQVAEAAAIIHNTPEEEAAGLAAFDVPPFELWYQVFLDNPTVRARLGKALSKRVRRLVLDKRRFMAEIDRFQSLIHCDFRPANMLVDECNRVYVVDWESASMGHSLADVGQFFRYRSFFKDIHIGVFQQAYNAVANRKLPDNWAELCLFRDLVNPLQLLSIHQEAPSRNADLIRIVEETLAYWDY